MSSPAKDPVAGAVLPQKLNERQEPLYTKSGLRAHKLTRVLSEPTLHFFLLGALLFLVHRLIAGDPRTIVISPVLRDDLARRFRDQSGHWPSPVELDASFRSWKADEALYREALRDRLDREDASVRTILAAKVRSRAAFEFQKRDPSEAELAEWLAQHRSLYETPLRYACDYVAFAKNSPAAEAQRTRYELALKAGASPATLGRPVFGPNLTRDQLREKFGPTLQERICSLPIGHWQRLESQEDLLLLRVNGIEGGLPSREVLHARLVSDWQSAMQQQAVERAVEAIVARYRFEERAR
jgi:hypothetical protein